MNYLFTPFLMHQLLLRTILGEQRAVNLSASVYEGGNCCIWGVKKLSVFSILICVLQSTACVEQSNTLRLHLCAHWCGLCLQGLCVWSLAPQWWSSSCCSVLRWDFMSLPLHIIFLYITSPHCFHSNTPSTVHWLLHFTSELWFQAQPHIKQPVNNHHQTDPR